MITFFIVRVQTVATAGAVAFSGCVSNKSRTHIPGNNAMILYVYIYDGPVGSFPVVSADTSDTRISRIARALFDMLSTS